MGASLFEQRAHRYALAEEITLPVAARTHTQRLIPDGISDRLIQGCHMPGAGCLGRRLDQYLLCIGATP